MKKFLRFILYFISIKKTNDKPLLPLSKYILLGNLNVILYSIAYHLHLKLNYQRIAL